LEQVTKLCVAGEKIVTICEKGDELLDAEIAKVYRGKKISKGESALTSISEASLTQSQASPTPPPSPHPPLLPHTLPLHPTRPKLQLQSRKAKQSRFNWALKSMVLEQ